MIKNIDDYVDDVCEKFPELSKKDITRILKFGMRSYYMHHLFGGDVIIRSCNFLMYTGWYLVDKIKSYNYYKIKSKIKVRVKYKRKNGTFDGYYYFGLTELQYQQYLALTSGRGRKRKNILKHNFYAYKIYDECIIDYKWKYIFSLKYPYDIGFTFYKKEYNILLKDIKLIAKRNEDNILIKLNNE